MDIEKLDDLIDEIQLRVYQSLGDNYNYVRGTTVEEMQFVIDGCKELISENARLQSIIDEANAQEPLGWVFPDDFEKLGNSECAADIYSVEQGHPSRGVTLPVYAARPIPAKSHDVEREELIRLIEAVRKWGI